jgi:hypothetical protein
MTFTASVASQLGAAVAAPIPGGGAPARGVVAAGQEAFLSFARDPFRLLLVALTIVNVSRVHQQFGFLSVFRPALLLVLAAAAYAYMYPKALTKAKLLSYWPMRRVAFLAVLSCFSVGFGISLGRSASFILDNYSKTLLYCVLLALAIRGARDLERFPRDCERPSQINDAKNARAIRTPTRSRRRPSSRPRQIAERRRGKRRTRSPASRRKRSDQAATAGPA